MDTLVSPTGGLRWLLLLPQLPPKPDYLRVKLQRRMQRLGAVALKNGVYVLPARDETVEDCEWLRRELEGDAAQLIVAETTLVGGLSDSELAFRFQSARADDYAGVVAAAQRAHAIDDRDARALESARVSKSLAAVQRVDFFAAPAGHAAKRAVSALQSSLTPEVLVEKPATPATVRQGSTWVTRKDIFVDRMASAWLIRRFIDARAKFKFVDGSRGYRPSKGEIRFDMYHAEFTHEGERCTFETLLARFGLSDAALAIIGEIVHDLDCQDDKFERPETFGIGAVLAGIRDSEPHDERRILLGRTLFDGLYTQFARRG